VPLLSSFVSPFEITSSWPRLYELVAMLVVLALMIAKPF
jgi:hypothetical protein